MKKIYSELCNRLGYYEVIPKPTPEELNHHYTEKYYQNAQGSYAIEYTPEELTYYKNIARVALNTARRLTKEESLYDLGCGEGFFSKAFNDFGWKVSCCDFSEFGIAKHNEDLLPFFSSGDIFELTKAQIAKKRTYGLINLQNVLEHVIDPVALLVEVKPLLGSKSIIRIKVPNDYSDFQKALIERRNTTKTWFSPPEHLSYFNKKGLENILQHCGYQVLSLQATFPIEVFLANNHSNYWKDRSLGKQAHLARIFCENHLIEANIEDYIDYSQAAARLGFGRELIAYAKLIEI